MNGERPEDETGDSEDTTDNGGGNDDHEDEDERERKQNEEQERERQEQERESESGYDAGADPLADVDVSERTGDPFERLGGSGGERESDVGPDTGETAGDGRPDERDRYRLDRQPLGATEPGSDRETDPEPAEDRGGEREPSDLLDDITTDPSLGATDDTGDEGERATEAGEGRGRFDGMTDRGDPFESVDAFEQVDAERLDLDQEAVWDDLSEMETSGSVTEQDGEVYAEVSKHRYCEQCEWFSEPPSTRCTHEGTEIIEFLDMETVRVLNCPIVEQRRELEEET